MNAEQLHELIRAAQCGDTRAWGPLVDEFLPTVIGTAYALGRDWDAAHDDAQESFAIAIDRIRELRDPAAFPAWLVAIVRSCASRARREATRAPERIHASAETAAPPLADAALARGAERERVRRAVEALPEQQRLPVVLHYYAQLPLAEIAAICELPLSTVKQRMRAARSRLRGAGDPMGATMLSESLQPTPRASEAVQLFCSVRAGDAPRTRALLDRHPELVDAREQFSTHERAAHRLALNTGGTPLLRAIERGYEPIVRLLLERGADPNGACACDGGEPPLWTATVHRRAALAELLLRAGADPNGAAFAGASALHVAAMRGYGELSELLLAHGADAGARDASGRTPAMWAPGANPPAAAARAAVWWTGVRALDLWSPLPRRGLARWSAPAGVGSVVLLCELAWRAAREETPVVWAGFADAPLARNDFAHALAELGVADRVTLAMPTHDAPRESQLAALAAALCAAAPEALLVIFEADGFCADVELRLPELRERGGLTIVVAPSGAPPPSPRGAPYLASVAFDPERAARRQWPALGAGDSWSRSLSPAHASLAARARRELARAGDRAAALHAWLAQPFFSAEPFSGKPGEWTSPEQLESELASLLGAPASA